MSEFTDFLPEAFAEFGPVQLRRMFGGHGVFHDGVMIGLVAQNTLYLKVDQQTKPLFEERGLEAFRYGKADRKVAMSYCQAPEEALEDPESMREWAELAYAAALRSQRHRHK